MLPDPRCHGQGGVNRLRPPGARRAVPVEKPSLAGDESGCCDTAGRAERRSTLSPTAVNIVLKKKKQARPATRPLSAS